MGLFHLFVTEVFVFFLRDLGWFKKKLFAWERSFIHDGKCEIMIISHKAIFGPMTPIKLGVKILDVVYETRSVGVIIDSQLSWNSHSEHLCKSFATLEGQLKRFKYLPTGTLEEIYFSSIVLLLLIAA